VVRSCERLNVVMDLHGVPSGRVDGSGGSRVTHMASLQDAGMVMRVGWFVARGDRIGMRSGTLRIAESLQDAWTGLVVHELPTWHPYRTQGWLRELVGLSPEATE